MSTFNESIVAVLNHRVNGKRDALSIYETAFHIQINISICLFAVRRCAARLLCNEQPNQTKRGSQLCSINSVLLSPVSLCREYIYMSREVSYR